MIASRTKRIWGEGTKKCYLTELSGQLERVFSQLAIDIKYLSTLVGKDSHLLISLTKISVKPATITIKFMH